MNMSHQRYIPGIDGLRAFAVVSVILFHLKSGLLPGGFSGVDVFFVISGYVVSGSLARDGEAPFAHFMTGFYARRILRIYPALICCLVAAALLQTLFIPTSWLSTTANKTGLAAFFGFSNFALIWNDDGYFSPRVEFNVFTHTWSLAVEEQFYLLFPGLFFLWSRLRGRLGWQGAVARWSLAAIGLASLLWSAYETRHAPTSAYYLLLSRFWELATGAALYQFHAGGGSLSARLGSRNLLVGVGLACIVAAFVLCDEKAFPFPWALLPVAGTAIAIAGVAERKHTAPLERVFTHPVAVYIGKLSYSLYLWHWVVIVLMRWTTGIGQRWQLVLAALLCAILAACSYHFVELPVRRNHRIKHRPNWRIVAAGLCAITLCAVTTKGLFHFQPRLSLSVTRDQQTWYPEAWPTAKLPTSMQLLAGRHLFVLGDSHAGAYTTMLQMLSDRDGVAFNNYSQGGCAIAGLRQPSEPRCQLLIRRMVDRVKQDAVPGDIVFLASLRVNRFGDQWATFAPADVQAAQWSDNAIQNRQIALAEADAVITELEQLGVTVVIDQPKPIFASPPFRCADWFNHDNPICSAGNVMDRKALLTHRQPILDSISVLQSRHPALVTWDPFPTLCPGQQCYAFDGKQPLFFDGDHLSAHGNRVLFPSFEFLVTHIWQGHGTTSGTQAVASVFK